MSNPTWLNLHTINSFGDDLGVTLGALSGGTTPAAAVFPAANDALFVPVYVKQIVQIKRLFCVNGVVSGNVDVGIFSKDGSLLRSSGSVAQSGANIPQFFDVTDITLGPELYYLAVAMNNTTGGLFRASHSVARLKAIGAAKMASAFPLPNTVTFATVSAAFLPLIGAEIFRVL